jgi:hypothetical protein
MLDRDEALLNLELHERQMSLHERQMALYERSWALHEKSTRGLDWCPYFAL